ncbi:transcription factor bHLH13-like [Typha latifolia]|uniref:transcription factor bHLH13-like n=1 Tax=Typha latifolia TaxID=4733 RepID=UPI003C2C0A22
MAMDGYLPPQLMINSPEGGSSGREKASTSSRSGKLDVIHMERNRREKMTEFYNILHSLVPNLFPKATRTRIIDETIKHIKHLEDVIMALDKQKAAAVGGTTTGRAMKLRPEGGSTIQVAASGITTFFGIRSPARPRLASRVLEVFEKHKAEVLSTTVACNDGVVSMTVTSAVLEQEVVEKIKGEIINI